MLWLSVRDYMYGPLWMCAKNSWIEHWKGLCSNPTSPTFLLQDLFWDPVLLLSAALKPKSLRREQKWNRWVNISLHSHCVFCKDSLDVDIFVHLVSSLHVKLFLIIQKEKNVTCSLNIQELLIVLPSSLHNCVFVQAHLVYNPSSYQTRRLLAPATRRHKLPEHPKRQLQPQCPL